MCFIWTGSDLNLQSCFSCFLMTLVNLLRRWSRWKPIAESGANLLAFQSFTLHPQVHHLFSFSLNCFMQPNQQMALLPTAMSDEKERDLARTVRLKDTRRLQRHHKGRLPGQPAVQMNQRRRSSQAEPLLWLVAEGNRTGTGTNCVKAPPSIQK